jgi:hypothetical protein
MDYYALAAITLAEIGANHVILENFKFAIYVNRSFGSSYSCKFKNCYYGLYAMEKGYLTAQNFEYVCDDPNLMPDNKGVAIESRYLSNVFISGTNTISGTDTLKVKGAVIGEESTLHFNSYTSLSLSNIGSYGLLMYGNSIISSTRNCSLSIDKADKGIYFYNSSGVTSNSFIFDKSRITMTNVTEEYFGMKENKINSLNNKLMLGNEPLSFEGWEGDTASRPTLNEANGHPYFDTDIGLPVWWNGTEWIEVSSGYLNRVVENGKIGYRLKGENPEWHREIGAGAIDLVQVDEEPDNNSYPAGASGMGSFAGGANGASSEEDTVGVLASGIGSFAWGCGGTSDFGDAYMLVASGNGSVAFGMYSKSTGDYSATFGANSESQGATSFSHGSSCIASGVDSYAAGDNSHASGNSSHAEGKGTIAKNTGMHAEGTYNVGSSTETIHETGIGTSDNSRKNAFEIYTDGKVVVPELTLSLIDDTNTSNKVITTKEYLQNNGETANRPANPSIAQMFFDTDLGQPIWWNGTDWVDALGNDPATVYVVE